MTKHKEVGKIDIDKFCNFLCALADNENGLLYGLSLGKIHDLAIMISVYLRPPKAALSKTSGVERDKSLKSLEKYTECKHKSNDEIASGCIHCNFAWCLARIHHLSLPNKSNEELIDRFKKDFPVSKDIKAYRGRDDVIDWLRSHLPNNVKPVGLPEV